MVKVGSARSHGGAAHFYLPHHLVVLWPLDGPFDRPCPREIDRHRMAMATARQSSSRSSL